MKLTKLEMYGFKSFLDRTQILFDDGVTAIVGPNGCGKSNVADAMRWVLGEQSVKNLRGSVMQDIIFNGTENKKSLSFCEVSLFFDNTDKSLPIEFDEVCITRKLYRSGESEYLINKSPCRLKDITDLMRIAQIGREGYSIIGQGRVEQFINLRPDERRYIFDEATGIAGAKQKKVEAERKLTRTEDNLVRYLDILGELEKQVEPLREQAETARKYIDYKEKLKYHEVNSFIYKTDYIDNEKQKLQDKIKAISDELSLKEQYGQELEEKYQSALSEIQKTDENIEQLHKKQLELVVARQKLESSNNLTSQKIDFLNEQNQTLTDDIGELNEDIKQFEEEINGLDSDLKEQQQYLAEKKQEFESLQQKLDKANKEIQDKNYEVEQSRSTYAEFNKKLNEINNAVVSLEKSKEYTEQLIKESSIDKQGKDEKISGLFDKIIENQENLNKNNVKIKTLREEVSKSNDELLKTKLELSKINDESSELEKERAGTQSQRNFLKKMKESYDGFSTSVRKLLLDSNENSRLKDKIEGTVANLVTVPKEYEIAIEATLGGAIQNIVTKTMEDAKFLIAYLKEKRYGIVTFLPISSMKPRYLNGEYTRCLTMQGVLGVASDLVSYDKKYDNVIKSLLGTTVVVDTIDNAIAVAKRFNSSFRIVTQDGAIFSANGSVSGGSFKPQISNILSYDREILDSESKLAQISDALDKITTKKLQLRDIIDKLQSEKDEKYSELQTLEIQIASLTESLKSLKNNRTDEEYETLQKVEKLEQYKSQLKEINTQLDDNENKKQLLISGSNIDESEIEAILSENENLRQNAKDIQEELTEARIEQVQINSEIASINLAADGLKTDIENAKAEIKSKTENLKTNKEIIESASQTIVDVSGDSSKEIDEISDKLSNFDNYKKEQNVKLKEVDVQRTQSLTETQKIINKKTQLEFDFDKIDSDLKILADKLLDEYELTYADAQFYKDASYKISASNSEIKKLREAILKLGNVNVNAIEDLASVNERYSEMTSQRDDMLKAQDDLNKVIVELNAEMKTKFDEGFSLVNTYFQETFKDLFGGGNACLKLIDNDTNDKLSYGVDIEAQPPGKSLQNINLLSGGEKALTAIAIIISIMKLRPMPFCIFDEIEAALDEVNTIRFSKYLEKFKGFTQFILVTHKKSTMEMANRIFGITMQEKGISKVVSVNLSDKKEKLIANG
ncbi:MAG: chromosome segregation protein SMC [Clostridia bacterium]